MKRNLRFLVFVLAAILVASSLFPLTFVRGERLYQLGGPNPLSALAQEIPAVLVQGPKDYSQDIDKVLRHYDKVQLDPARSAAQVHQTRRLSLPTSEGNFDLTLELRDMRSAGYKAQETLDGGVIRELEDQPVRTYKGSVAGMPEAQARLTIDEDTLEGLIITPGQIYFIEPAKHYSALAQRTDFVIYKQSDLLQASFGDCGVTLAEKVGAEAARVHSEASGLSFGQNKGAAALFSPPRIVDLATEADFEYFTAFGSSAAANNEIIGVMNQVEGIYNTQFGLQFSLVFQNVWATVDDVYTSTDASTALDEFTGYWNANHGSVFRDLAHMWTGKSFNGNTIGIAWQPGLDCPLAANGYGMSERLSSAPGKFIVTAHEIGHNFNATHADAQPGCANTIMGTTLNSSTSQTFCAFSVNEIDARANAKAACLSQVLTPGCTYTLSATSRSFSASGGTGSVNVSSVGSNCVWAANSSASWITITAGNSGTNGGAVSFSVASNSNGYARTGLVRIAEQDFLVTQAGGASCTTVPIGGGQTVNGVFAQGDCISSQRDQSFAHQYSFIGVAGDQISIDLSRTGSSTVDTYLYLIGPSGAVVNDNDDVA
ncbi:MAG: M12 family metallo-peptidase, partial [Acidobacteriota bacterium]